MNLFSHLIIYFSVLVSFTSSLDVWAASPRDRFFLMGSGILHLKNLRNNREARVELLTKNGGINESSLNAVDHVFGFPSHEKTEHISLRLLFMLSYFADRVAPEKKINIESAYRSPEYNEQLRKQGANAARTSTHMDGMALDFWIEGVDGKKLWETVRSKNCCGVGHYGGKTIHLDAGRPRFWEAATSGTRSAEPDYNRNIYLSTLYDRYAPGERVRLSLSGISTFGFGVCYTARLIRTGDPAARGHQLPLGVDNQQSAPCLQLDNRKATHLLSTSLPASLPSGRYQLQLDFCRKPFPQMPAQVISRQFEVIP